VVAWTSDGQDGSSGGIFAQRFNASGVAVGPEWQVNSVTAGSQSYGHVAGLSDGGFRHHLGGRAAIYDGFRLGRVSASATTPAASPKAASSWSIPMTSSTQHHDTVASYSRRIRRGVEFLRQPRR
jgi:hypothetical protein